MEKDCVQQVLFLCFPALGWISRRSDGTPGSHASSTPIGIQFLVSRLENLFERYKPSMQHASTSWQMITEVPDWPECTSCSWKPNETKWKKNRCRNINWTVHPWKPILLINQRNDKHANKSKNDWKDHVFKNACDVQNKGMQRSNMHITQNWIECLLIISHPERKISLLFKNMELNANFVMIG